MTPDAQQPQREYIITEEQLSKIEKRYIPGEYGLRIIKEIRTRPHATAPSRLCDECNILELEDHVMNLEQDLKDARTATLETLDKLDEFLNSDDHLSLFKWEVRDQIRAIRTAQEQP